MTTLLNDLLGIVDKIQRIAQTVVQSVQQRRQLRRRVDNLEGLVRQMKQRIDDCGTERPVTRAGEVSLDHLLEGLEKAEEALSEQKSHLEMMASTEHSQSLMDRFLGCCCGCLKYAKYAQISQGLEDDLELWNAELETRSEIAHQSGAFLRRRRVCENLPPNYIRLENVADALLSNLRFEKEKIIVLHGMFGMGKSSLALDVALELDRGHDFPGGVYFLRFGEEYGAECRQVDLDAKILLEQKSLLSYLSHENIHHLPTPKVGKAEIWHCLSSKFPDKLSLIVLDDVWNNQIIQSFNFQGQHSCKLLVTTRDGRLWPTSPECMKFELQPHHILAEGLDRRLLSRNSGRKVDQTTPDMKALCDRILEKCGGCPLAVGIVGSSLRDKSSWEWESVVEEFSGYAMTTPANDGYKHTIYSAISTSERRLTDAEYRLFKIMSMFTAKDFVPASLVELAWQVTESPGKYFHCVMDGLARANLVRRIKDLDDNVFYSIHSIVSEYLHAKHEIELDLISPKLDFNTLTQENDTQLLAAFLLSYGTSDFANKSIASLGLDVIAGGGHIGREVKSIAVQMSVKSKPKAAAVLAATLRSSARMKVCLDKFEDALVDLKVAGKLESDNPKTARMLGKIKSYFFGDCVGGLADLNRAIELEPCDVMTLWSRAYLKWAEHDDQGALEELDKGVSLEPNNSLLYSLRGILKFNLGDQQGAAEDRNNADITAVNRYHSVENLRLRGCLKRALGDTDGSNSDLQTSFQKADQRLRGTLKGVMGDYVGAVVELDKYIEGRKNLDWFSLKERAVARYLTGNLEGALDDLNQARKSHPMDAEILWQRGHVKRLLLDFDGARKDHDAAYRIRPQRPAGMYVISHLGILHVESFSPESIEEGS